MYLKKKALNPEVSAGPENSRLSAVKRKSPPRQPSRWQDQGGGIEHHDGGETGLNTL